MTNNSTKATIIKGCQILDNQVFGTYNCIMKEKLFSILFSTIGNGYVKNIVGPKGCGSFQYLISSFSKYIKSKQSLFTIINCDKYNKKEIKNLCLSIKNDKNRYIIFINHLWSYIDFDSIINICVESNNIDLFFTSINKYPVFNYSKWITVRGRIYSVFFPSTLYEDYVLIKKNANYIDFLFNNNLDNDIIKENYYSLNDFDRQCFEIILNYNTVPISSRNLAKDISNETKILISKNRAQRILTKFIEGSLIYLIPRYDYKFKETVRGPLVYPIDTRFYKDQTKNSINLNKFMMTAVISKLFYDNWEVYKGIYESQRNNRTYIRNNDGGFLIRKDKRSYIIFIRESIENELIKTILYVPSSIQKIIITPDTINNITQDSNGILIYSLEHFLKKGLLIYEGN